MWNQKTLKDSLDKMVQNGEVESWSTQQIVNNRKEYYLIGSESKDVVLDQDRRVDQDSLYCSVVVSTKDPSEHGVARRALFPQLDLSDQLKKLAQAATVSTERKWKWPEPSQKAEVDPTICYQGLAENFEGSSEAILEDMVKSIQGTAVGKDGVFNSSEIFVSKENVQTTNSLGFETSSQSSKIFSEVCFSCDRSPEESQEYLVTGWNCHPEQFQTSKMCEDSIRFAEHSLQTMQPPSGQFSVILHKDVVAEVFFDVLTHLNASAKYYEMPFMESGKDFVKDFQGTPFDLTLDPNIDYLLGSGRFDQFGRAQKPLNLIQNNQISSNIVSPQYAQYLGWEETPQYGNLRLEPESVSSFEALTQSAPKVLEVLQFSGLFTSPLDLTFSSEIRLGRLYDNESGKVEYIKGGSLSGSLLKNLRSVQWSGRDHTTHVAEWGGFCRGYQGPEFALFTDVNVTA